jgi:hypothetical protein
LAHDGCDVFVDIVLLEFVDFLVFDAAVDLNAFGNQIVIELG